MKKKYLLKKLLDEIEVEYFNPEKGKNTIDTFEEIYMVTVKIEDKKENLELSSNIHISVDYKDRIIRFFSLDFIPMNNMTRFDILELISEINLECTYGSFMVMGIEDNRYHIGYKIAVSIVGDRLKEQNISFINEDQLVSYLTEFMLSKTILKEKLNEKPYN